MVLRHLSHLIVLSVREGKIEREGEIGGGKERRNGAREGWREGEIGEDGEIEAEMAREV